MNGELYTYTALDASGSKVRGEVMAIGEQEACRALSARGLTPLKVSMRRKRGPIFSSQRVSKQDIADVTRELAVLIEAKIPLARSLHSIAEQESNSALASMIRSIATAIEAGEPLTHALDPYRDTFGEVYLETLRAAEKSGNLAEVMGYLAELLDRQIESSQQLRRAMTYPAIVLSVVVAAVTVIVVFVVPKFADTFSSQGVELPTITKWIQVLGESVKAYWWAYLGGFGTVLAATLGYAKSPDGHDFFERLLLRIPYLGRIVVLSTVAQLTRVMSIGLSSGLGLIESIELGGRASGRNVIRAECDGVASALRGGQELPTALAETRYIPPFAKRMLVAGKDSAELSRACGIVAKHFDRESSHLTKNINTVIEPLLTVAMAGIVLLVALSVFLPMWQMVKIKH